MSIIPNAGNSGIAFVVSTGAVWECIAFACSSPQTVQINYQKRGDTLMMWVHAGQGLALLTIIIAASIDKRDRAPILAGGLFGMISAEAFYLYAADQGSKSSEPMTEDY